VLAAVVMIDDLDAQITAIDQELKALGADHPYIPTLMTAPGVAWVLGYTIASEIGDIHRFASPKKLCSYTGLCPRVYQSGNTDRRGHLSHAGPKYLRWALIEAAVHACRHPVYRNRYQRNKTRLGRQRGTKVAQVDIARRLAEAIWHMLRSASGRLSDISSADLDLAWAVNARASVLLTQAFAEHHDDSRPDGRILLFTSGQHRGPMADELPYTISKGAVHQMTASLADALADRSITVNAMPSDTLREELRPAFPAGRWGQPEDIAKIATWLVSADSAWLTGQVIDAEGGFRR
jgi:hypothetical protein